MAVFVIRAGSEAGTAAPRVLGTPTERAPGTNPLLALDMRDLLPVTATGAVVVAFQTTGEHWASGDWGLYFGIEEPGVLVKQPGIFDVTYSARVECLGAASLQLERLVGGAWLQCGIPASSSFESGNTPWTGELGETRRRYFCTRTTEVFPDYPTSLRVAAYSDDGTSVSVEEQRISLEYIGAETPFQIGGSL